MRLERAIHAMDPVQSEKCTLHARPSLSIGKSIRNARLIGSLNTNVFLALVICGTLTLFSSTPGYSTEALTISSIAAGGGHSCVLLSDRTVRCFGDNREGRLGNGTPGEAWDEVQVAGIDSAQHIAAGLNFSCAVLADGTVRCWGGNKRGQLGDG